MKDFPTNIGVKNKENFSELYYKKAIYTLRNELYEHIISKEENSYFEIDKFQKKYYNVPDKISEMITEVIHELNLLGWNCKLSYGGTALFIYSTEKPPPSCWDDGL